LRNFPAPSATVCCKTDRISSNIVFPTLLSSCSCLCLRQSFLHNLMPCQTLHHLLAGTCAKTCHM
jgi:hypothetical protein